MRLLFATVMFFGTVVLSLGAILLYYSVWATWSSGAQFNIRALFLPTLLLLGAGACAAGIFMSPREFREATKPVEEHPVQRPAWLDDLAKPPPVDDKREP